jgi:hypothetical protein
MQLTDQRDIKADPATVWAAILNPEVLMACVPGCESMTGTPETGFEAVVVQKVGPVKARFTGVVTLSDMVPGQSLRIRGEGKGGPAGFAKGGANVTLAAIPGGTRLSYDVEANVGGKLAQLGSRLRRWQMNSLSGSSRPSKDRPNLQMRSPKGKTPGAAKRKRAGSIASSAETPRIQD